MQKNIKNLFLSLCAILLSNGLVFANVLEFAQVGDVHYSINNSGYDKYLYFLSLSLRKTAPNFIIFLGDNVDNSQEDDVIDFMRAIHPIKSPYYLVLGNRDTHKLNGLEKANYLDIVTTFNKNQKDNENYYYFKPNSDIVCVVLDETPDFAPSNHGEIPDEQLEWLDNLLTKYPKKLFMIFQHSPILPPRDEYKLSMLNTEKYKEILQKHSNVILISSGHYHQEAVLTDDNGVRHISAPAFFDIPHSYQLIKVIYDPKTYTSPKDVEIIITKVKV